MATKTKKSKDINSKEDIKKLLLQNLDSARKTTDKALLTLSTTALGASVYFLKFLNESLIKECYLYLLVASWWLFGLTIITTLLSHACTEKHSLCAFDYINGGEKDEGLYDKSNKWNKRTIQANGLSLTLLILGIIMFLLFASLNFADKYMSNNQNNNKTYTPTYHKVDVTKKGAVTPSSAIKPPANSNSGSNGKK